VARVTRLTPRTDLKQKKKDAPGIRGGQHGATNEAAKAKTVPKPAPHHGGEPSKHSETKPKEHDGHDRHLGATARKEQQKKQGGGSHNWGKPEDLAKEGELPKVAPSPAPEAEAAAPEPEPEEPQLTLEEYEALQAAKRSGPAFAQKQVRQVKKEVVGTEYHKNTGETEDDFYVKPKTAAAAAAAAGETKAATKAEPKKQILQVDLRVRDTSAPPPRSGGRGGLASGDRSGGAPRDDYRPPRTGGGRGRGAGPDRGAGPVRTAAGRGAINTEDSAAFPKLGTA